MSKKKRPWYYPRKSRRPQRWALAVVFASLVGAAWAANGAYRQILAYPERPGEGGETQTKVEIPRGSSFDQILARLIDAGVLAEDEGTAFKLFVLHKGAANKITAGEHVFRGDMTPIEVLDELMRRQRVRELDVTIPEGKQMLQVAQILADAELGDAAEYERLMRDPEFLSAHGIEEQTAEGYLFPDTYRFSERASEAQVLARLFQRHQRVWDELRREHRQEARDLQDEFEWGHHEVLTMASIVEKETGQAVERPRIASVFLNRLRFSTFKPKLLQTDPTIIYGCTVPASKSKACQSFEGRIRRVHLTDPDNIYNTYTHEGLPPGPISNPGRAAMEAVLVPERSRYLYFVARNDGTHQFSKTRAEHEAAVDKFIRGNAVGSGDVDLE